MKLEIYLHSNVKQISSQQFTIKLWLGAKKQESFFKNNKYVTKNCVEQKHIHNWFGKQI